MLIVLKSESLIFLETSGPIEACNGIALPLQSVLETVDVKFSVFIDMCSIIDVCD